MAEARPPQLHHTRSQVALGGSPEPPERRPSHGWGMRGSRKVDPACDPAREPGAPPSLHHTGSQVALLASPMRPGRVTKQVVVKVKEEQEEDLEMEPTSLSRSLRPPARAAVPESPLAQALGSARQARRQVRPEAEAIATAKEELAQLARLESVDEHAVEATARRAPAVAGPCQVDMPPMDFLVHTLLHQVDLKVVSLAVALGAVPGVIFGSFATNSVYSARADGGYAPSAEVADLGTVLDSISGDGGHAPYVAFYLLAALWSAWAVTWWVRVAVVSLIKREPTAVRRWRYMVAVVPALGYLLLFAAPQTIETAGVLVFFVQLACIGCLVRAAAAATGWMHFRWLTFAIFLPIVIVLLFYSRVLPGWLFGDSTEDAAAADQRILLLRLVVHPVVVELCMFPLRLYGREFPGVGGDSVRLAACGTLGICNLYGRFMAATLQSWTAIVLCVVGMSAQELLMRATTLMRDEWYLWPVLGRDRARRYAKSARSARVKSDMLVVDQLTEDAGIFVAAAWCIFGRLSYNSTSTVPVLTVLGSALFQLAAEVLTDAAPAVMSAHVRGTVIPPGYVRGLLFRVKQAVANSHNSWLTHSRHHRLAVALSIGHWAVFIMHFNLAPNKTWCAASALEIAGTDWWHQVPCPLLSPTESP